MFKIKNCENIFLKKIEEYEQKNGKIYILGAGECGKKLYEALSYYGKNVDGFVVDKDKIERPNTGEIICTEDVLKMPQCVLLIIAINGYDLKRMGTLSDTIEILYEDIFSLWAVEECGIDYDYYTKHLKEFQHFYSMLSDPKFIACVEAYINQKISGKFGELQNLWETNAYYDSNLIDLCKINTIVDCGAYNGDSFLAFAEAFKESTGCDFGGTAYLLEPNIDNYEQLDSISLNYKGVKPLQIGAWDKEDELTFLTNGTSSGIVSAGDVSICVDCIDHILQGERADFIKMDIEGAELYALKGARNTIETYHPILAICVYHRREDLITIPEYIRTLYEGYKFYIRAYSLYSTELVLYAVP